MTDRWSDNTSADRAQYMVDIDIDPLTIAEQKRRDPRTPGTASDFAGTTKNYRDLDTERGIEID